MKRSDFLRIVDWLRSHADEDNHINMSAKDIADKMREEDGIETTRNALYQVMRDAGITWKKFDRENPFEPIDRRVKNLERCNNELERRVNELETHVITMMQERRTDG